MNGPYVAAGLSMTTPLPGQDHRSGPYFQFTDDLASGGTLYYAIRNADDGSPEDGVTAVLMHDRGGLPDQTVAKLSSSVSSVTVEIGIEKGANYYLEDPVADDAFVVVFGTG
ncbi:MAG: hypothetical protein QOE05_255 [Actinomycetota bacterium]|nr:hypothetical protein [Actinomycetota bacterium]